MNILVPLNNHEYINEYIEAGADEFYMGFHDHRWEEEFGEFADINRMSGFRQHANRYSFEEALFFGSKLHEKGKKIYVTLNANCYSMQQLEYMERNYFPLLKDAVDGVIVSDLHEAERAIQAGLNAISSTMCGIYNADIAKIYSDLGVKRIILPRDLSVAEIGEIVAEMPEIEFEVFFMRNGCAFSDAFCLGMHRKECGAICGHLKRSPKIIIGSKIGFHIMHDIRFNDGLYNNRFHHSACGMCALYRLKENNISSLKIVGRADDESSVLKDIMLTKKNIEIAQSSQNEQEYLERMEFPENFGTECIMGMNCYYPEIRFGEETLPSIGSSKKNNSQ